MAAEQTTELMIRTAEPRDNPALLEIFRLTLGWQPGDPNEGFFHWKHKLNAFGESPAWVALDGDRVVGYRTFMRWRFIGDDGKRVTAVRAVDTATHPDYQGRGIFRRVTLQGVADLTLAGDGIVFNTPNDKSRPGYLKMGWSQVGRLPVGVLPRGPRSMARMVTSKVPAALWSDDTSAGLAATEAFTDRAVAEALLTHAPGKGFRTDRTPEYLAWRTSFEPLKYRLLLASPNDPAEGGIVFRLRRRGATVEAAVIEQLVPNRRTGARLIARMLKETGADYAIGLRSGPSAGLLPLPGQGPLLTSRPLASSPPSASAWTLTLGDIELF